MIIGRVNGVSFGGNKNIIDAHMHYGHWKDKNNQEVLILYDKSFLDQFVKSPLDVTVGGVKEQNSVERILLSNSDCFLNGGIKDEYDANKELLELSKDDPKYSVMAACKPSENGNAVKINRLLKEYPDRIVGLKFHPREHNIAPDSTAYKPYLRLAERFKLPCLIHSDVQFKENGQVAFYPSSPEAIYKAAKTIPNTPVIMAHLGAGDERSHQNAIDVLLKSIDNNDAKLYADISWVNWGKDGLSLKAKPSLEKLITELQRRNATDRILFGTDAPLGCFGEKLENNLSPKQAYEKTVSDLKTFLKEKFPAQAEELTEKIFYKNADELFYKKDWAKVKGSTPNGGTAAKIVGTIFAGVVLVSGIGYLIDKINPPKYDRFNK